MLPLPFLLPLYGFLSSLSLHLAGPYNFFWPCSCHCVQTLLHAFLSNAFNKSISRALQVLLYKSIIILYKSIIILIIHNQYCNRFHFRTWNSRASNPLKTNSNKVCKFSGIIFFSWGSFPLFS